MEDAVRRTVIVSVVASSAVSVLLTVLVGVLVFPAAVEAQAARLRAEDLVIVAPDGAESLWLRVNPQTGGRQVQVVGADGTLRVQAGTGGQGASRAEPDLKAAGV